MEVDGNEHVADVGGGVNVAVNCGMNGSAGGHAVKVILLCHLVFKGAPENGETYDYVVKYVSYLAVFSETSSNSFTMNYVELWRRDSNRDLLTRSTPFSIWTIEKGSTEADEVLVTIGYFYLTNLELRSEVCSGMLNLVKFERTVESGKPLKVKCHTFNETQNLKSVTPWCSYNDTSSSECPITMITVRNITNGTLEVNLLVESVKEILEGDPWEIKFEEMIKGWIEADGFRSGKDVPYMHAIMTKLDPLGTGWFVVVDTLKYLYILQVKETSGEDYDYTLSFHSRISLSPLSEDPGTKYSKVEVVQGIINRRIYKIDSIGVNVPKKTKPYYKIFSLAEIHPLSKGFLRTHPSDLAWADLVPAPSIITNLPKLRYLGINIY